VRKLQGVEAILGEGEEVDEELCRWPMTWELTGEENRRERNGEIRRRHCTRCFGSRREGR